MEYDFLPNEEQNSNSSTQTNSDGNSDTNFSLAEFSFFDEYKNHLDAHTIFSLPKIRGEWNLKANYDRIDRYMSDARIRDKINDNFYGTDTSFEKLRAGYTEFQNPTLLANTISEINEEIKTEMFSNIEKPKMNINDRLGLFSFDLASMQMNYVYEYFKNSDNTKVDANNVKRLKDGRYCLIDQETVFLTQKIKRRENGTPVVISSIKKCFIDFEKKMAQERSVEIIVLNSFSFNERARNIIFNSMAAISTAKNLILKGFKVKITSLLVVKGDEKEFYYHFVPVKKFNEPLDINAAAYVCGDARFFRYQGFKMLMKGYDSKNKDIAIGLGSIISNVQQVAKVVEQNYVPNSKLLQADSRLYFGGSRNLDAAKNEVQQAINILNNRYGE